MTDSLICSLRSLFCLLGITNLHDSSSILVKTVLLLSEQFADPDLRLMTFPTRESLYLILSLRRSDFITGNNSVCSFSTYPECMTRLSPHSASEFETFLPRPSICRAKAKISAFEIPCRERDATPSHTLPPLPFLHRGVEKGGGARVAHAQNTLLPRLWGLVTDCKIWP